MRGSNTVIPTQPIIALLLGVIRNWGSKNKIEGGFGCVGSQEKRNPVLGIAIPVLGIKLTWWLCVFWYFFDIDLRPAISMESSRRDPLNDMAEHKPTLKNNRNTHYSTPLVLEIDLCSATQWEALAETF